MTTKRRGNPAARSAERAVTIEVDRVTGILAHRLIGLILVTLAAGPVDDVPMLVLRLGARLVADEPALAAQRNRARMRVITAAGQYVSRYRPFPPTAFLGVETPVLDGRIDIAWRHPRHGVFFDEIKTSRHPGRVPDRDREQLSRYLSAGTTRYGSEFAGVRYLPLLNPAGAVHATSDTNGRLTLTPLSATPLALMRLAGQDS